MDVQIDEVHSTIEGVGADAVLSPQVLDHIVRSVIQALERKQQSAASRAADLDVRSIVDQQRAGRR